MLCCVGNPGPSELAALDEQLFFASQYMLSGQMSLGQPYFPPYQQYVTRFKQAYPDPDPASTVVGWSSIAYDTVYYIAHAIRNCLNANTSLSYDNILKQFRTMSVEGVTGTVTLQKVQSSSHQHHHIYIPACPSQLAGINVHAMLCCVVSCCGGGMVVVLLMYYVV